MDLGSGIRDPGSGKNLFRIPDPGVKKAPDPGYGSATLPTRINLYLKNKLISWIFLPNCYGCSALPAARKWGPDRTGKEPASPHTCPPCSATTPAAGATDFILPIILIIKE